MARLGRSCLSPECLINGNLSVGGTTVAASSPVTIQLASISGVDAWDIYCVSSDETSSPSSINASLTVNQFTRTATFTAPAGIGRNLLFLSRVNNGIANGQEDTRLTTTFSIYVLTALGRRVLAAGETIEGSTQFGWVATINAWLRSI